MGQTLGEKIFADIESNKYLQELFNAILYNYSLLLFHIDQEPHLLDLNDALRFADLLSKSTDEKHSELHMTWAQEIVALLYRLYPENESVKYYMGSVLSNVSNYRGLAIQSNKYIPVNAFDKIYDQYKKSLLQIPTSNDGYFFQSQKRVYDSLSRDRFSYSGPTSMGKSFVIRMFIKERLTHSGQENYAIIVPTKALINETSSRIIDDLQEMLEEKNYRVITTSGALSLQQDHHFILVLTPERLLYLLLDYPDLQLDYLFIDEAHKISSKDSRSPFYYKIVSLLSAREQKPHFIFSSPNIPNPEVYLKLISDNADTGDKLATSFSPVSQLKYIIDLVDQKIALHNDHNNQFIQIPFSSHRIELDDVIHMAGNGCQNIVYCSSTTDAISFALDYAKSLPLVNDSLDLEALSRDIGNEIHNDYYLSELILKGVAYHVGYLPNTIRMRIEDLFRNGEIKTIFCTSTLIEGINLPADNLFVTSYKNGRSHMTPVDFRNLIGRVGRIEYNLYGNVFLVRLKENIDIKKYTELIEKEIPLQKLSLASELKPKYKQYIVESLLQGNIELLKQKGQSLDNYSLMRKFALILLKDIMSNRSSLVHKDFSPYLDSEKEKQIREAFQHRPLDNDINISVDQVENLTVAIEGGLYYPSFNANGNVDYEGLVRFLEKLCKIFKWEIYEASTLGHISKESGNHGKLRWYAVILAQWIRGNGLSLIMQDAIEYKQKNPSSCVEINGQFVEYDDSKFHRNIVISDTLNAIEDVILFRISNYFLRFSAEYKRIHNISSMENDWYEYVEYGTTNPLTIFLQRNGFSRESATYIKQHEEYIHTTVEGYKIDAKLLTCQNKSVRKEAAEMKYNIPDLFIS